MTAAAPTQFKAVLDQDELAKVVKPGSPYIEMSFSDVFSIVDKDPKFGGIMINSASDSSYVMPRELFDRVRPVMNSATAGKP